MKPLVGSAAAAMTEWLAVLQAHGVQEGKIFRRIRKGGHLGEPLAAAAVRDIVKERCALAGIEGRFSAHSLRAGFVTEAGKQNMPLPETMAMRGHQSVATVVGYFRAESALSSKVSRMLDESREPQHANVALAMPHLPLRPDANRGHRGSGLVDFVDAKGEKRSVDGELRRRLHARADAPLSRSASQPPSRPF